MRTHYIQASIVRPRCGENLRKKAKEIDGMYAPCHQRRPLNNGGSRADIGNLLLRTRLRCFASGRGGCLACVAASTANHALRTPYGHQVQQCAARSSCVRRAASESQRPSVGTGRDCRKAACLNGFTATFYARAAAPRWHAGCATRGNQFTRRWAHAPPRTLAETPDQRHGAEQQPCDRWRGIVVTAEPARFSGVARGATSVGLSGC